MLVNASLTPVGTRLSGETTQDFPRHDLSLTDRSVAASLAAPTEAPTRKPVTTPDPTAVPSTPLPQKMPTPRTRPNPSVPDHCAPR